MWISIGVGAYYFFNAFFPIITWYGIRKDDILAMSNNGLYKAAWYSFYPLHWFVFTPMALLWPLTYTGSAVVVDFYEIANIYLGTILAGGVYMFVFAMFMLSYVSYDEATTLT